MNPYARTGILLACAALVIGSTALAVTALADADARALPTLTTIPGAALLAGACLALIRAREPHAPASAAKPIAPRLRLLALASGALTLAVALLLALNAPVLRVVLMTALALQGSLCLWWAGKAKL